MPRQKYAFKPKTVLQEWASQFSCVQTWLNKMNGAKANRAYLLALYCDWAKKGPDILLLLKTAYENLDAEKLLDSFVAACPYPECTTWNCVITVRSFYRCNYRELQREGGRMEYVPKRVARLPSKEKRLILYENCFNPRDRALLSVACTSGLALETLACLKWSHFEEDWARQDCPHISVPPELVKGHGKGKYRGVRQETFITPLTKRELIKYREWMTRFYGVFWNEGMNVFLTLEKPYNPLARAGISKTVESISHKASVPFSVHDGRRIVETALENVSTPRNWIQKIKGRKVRGEDAPYSKPLIEQLRVKYKEAIDELEFLITAKHVSLENMVISDEDMVTLKGLLQDYREGRINRKAESAAQE
jgi:hypothetical protein